jgi:ABC-type Co2+ transport system permease subunit
MIGGNTMNPHEARVSLDDIRRLQDRTRDAYVRHGFSRTSLLIMALAMFVMIASLDLPSPWPTVGLGIGLGLLAGLGLAQQRRAPVRRRLTWPEALYCAGTAAVFLVALVAFELPAALAVLTLDLPVQHTISGAALAATFLAGAGPVRRGFAAIVRNESRRG